MLSPGAPRRVVAMDRYRVRPPDGGAPWVLELEPYASVRSAYERVAERFGIPCDDLVMLVRDPPRSLLPTLQISCSDESMRDVVPPNTMLIAYSARLQATADAANDDSTAPAPEAAAPPTPSLGGSDMPPPQLDGDGEAASGPRAGLVGLRNLGNTCYFNSSLQCLSQTPLLTDIFFGSSWRACVGSKDGEVARSYASTLAELWARGAAAGANAVAPTALRGAIGRRRDMFRGSDQQDAQELLASLLEELHDDLNRSAKAPAAPVPPFSRPLLPWDRDADPQRAAMAWAAAIARDSSIVTDCFQGLLRSTVRCAGCGAAEATFEVFWSLAVPIPPSEGSKQDVALERALEAFFAEEELETARLCEACGRQEKATRKLDIWRPPQVLVLQLKRFEYQAPQNTQPPLLPKRPRDEPADKAETQAVAIDQGTTRGGAPEAAVPPPKSASTPTEVDGECVAVDANAKVKLPLLERLELTLPWASQETMYGTVLHILRNASASPTEAKFRSVRKTAAKLQATVLAVEGGPELLEWAGFLDTGERYELSDEAVASAESKRAELEAHAPVARDRCFRRERDARIAEVRRRELPTGDGIVPIRRWGGRLGFGGFGGFASARCTKVRSPIVLAADATRLRGHALLNMRHWAAAEAETSDEAAWRFELDGVVEHLGSTPHSGHYVAHCWHRPSGAWHVFDDARVLAAPPGRLPLEAAGAAEGAYLLFFESLSLPVRIAAS